LDAELAIRRLQFDQARSLLENVVRAGETEAGLRGRAQWMIGETYYLQQDFADAIDAYRRVEGIDPQGVWVSAALIQAGKSFEQLGRTREAAVCYGHLIGRFADTAHATLARRRLAAIAPDHQPSNPHSSGTIRR
jgi:TolA-binding protein